MKVFAIANNYYSISDNVLYPIRAKVHGAGRQTVYSVGESGSMLSTKLTRSEANASSLTTTNIKLVTLT